MDLINNNKKALSSIIAAVLMLAIIAATVVIAQYWSEQMQSETQSTVDATINATIKGCNHQVIIESQLMNKVLCVDGRPSVCIRNIGKDTINAGIYSLYINGQHCSDAVGTELVSDNVTNLRFDKISKVCSDLCEYKPWRYKITGPGGISERSVHIYSRS